VKWFDAGVLESIDRAQPFPKPPNEILSAGESAYVQWDFSRGDMACSSVNAYPYMLAP
jgi:hypothetical protein